MSGSSIVRMLQPSLSITNAFAVTTINPCDLLSQLIKREMTPRLCTLGCWGGGLSWGVSRVESVSGITTDGNSSG